MMVCIFEIFICLLIVYVKVRLLNCVEEWDVFVVEFILRFVFFKEVIEDELRKKRRKICFLVDEKMDSEFFDDLDGDEVVIVVRFCFVCVF